MFVLVFTVVVMQLLYLMVYGLLIVLAPCGPREREYRPDPFPGWMALKALNVHEAGYFFAFLLLVGLSVYKITRMLRMKNFVKLTPSAPAVSNCCCSEGSAPYWFNPPFLIFDIWALWRSVLSARVPECQKLKMVG